MFWLFVILTIVFGVLRFTLPVTGEINKKDIFKNLAHVFVGMLIGLAIGAQSWDYGTLAILITVLEVVAFITRKK
jgi:hypothetical protein